jgi:hypothetical protein
MYRRAVYYYVPSAARIQGLDVPIRPLIQIEFGPSFEREDVAALTTAFEATLKKLGLIDRNDPMALTVVKAVTPSQTLRIYAHLFRNDDRKAAAAIDAALARMVAKR